MGRYNNTFSFKFNITEKTLSKDRKSGLPFKSSEGFNRIVISEGGRGNAISFFQCTAIQWIPTHKTEVKKNVMQGLLV